MTGIFTKVLFDLNFLGAFLQTVIVILLGYFFRRYNLVDNSAKKTLQTIVWKIAVPCIAFNAFMQDFDKKLFISGLRVLYLTAFFYALLTILGRLVFAKQGKSFAWVSGLFIAVGQVTLFSMPILQSVYTGRDEQVMLYISMVSIVFRIMVYIVAYLIISGEKFDIKKIGYSAKKIFVTPIMISMALGIVVYLIQNITPQVITESGSYSFLRIDKSLPALYVCVKSLSRLLNPLSMFLIGISIGESDFKSALKDLKAWCVAIGRNFIAPVVVLFICYLINKTGIMHFDEYLLITIVIGFSAPVSVTISITCAQLHKHEDFASRVCLISTLISLISIPLNFVLTYFVLSL